MRELLHAYHDGELDLVRALEVESHLHDCPACSRAHQEIGSLRVTLTAAPSLYHRAPPGLSEQVRYSLRAAGPSRRFTRFPRRWLGVAAMIALAALGAWGLGRGLSAPSAEERLADEVIAGHVRSTLVAHLTDVASSDRHTVKPWFSGKLDFAPPVSDLAAEGFPLVGGRLDYLDRRPVAALVYRRRDHVINLFVWPAARDTDARPRELTRQGYNVVRWSRGGLEFWAVSDLDGRELRDFAGAVGR
jgi:anti-sigma factor RsiW